MEQKKEKSLQEKSVFSEPTEKMSTEEEFEISVIDALENSQHDWRTKREIAEELNLDIKIVENVLLTISRSRPRILVKSSRRTSSGEALYTTVKHYKKQTPMRRRLASAFLNKVD